MANELSIIDGYCELTKTSLSFKREVTKNEWQKVFDACRHIEGCIQFWIGDLLKYREQKWGMYDDIAEQTGYDRGTLQNIKSVSDKVNPNFRNEHLSFAHHQQVAPLPAEKQVFFLKKADEEKLSVRDLRREIHKEKYSKSIGEAKALNGKYRIIYADPPWSYGNDRTFYGGDPVSHYPTMTIDQLCTMPIKEMAEDNSVLFIWVTSPLLDECFSVITAWGFKYKSSFVWDKVKHNMGHYNSVRHELLLICTRGSCLPDSSKLIDSVVSIERTEHSTKPDEFRNIIEEMYNYGNKIELFARIEKDGWDSYGNQI